MTFGDWLAREREKQELTLDDLAAKSKVSKGTLYTVERGETQPRIDTAQKIAKGLGLTMWQMFKKVAEAGKRS